MAFTCIVAWAEHTGGGFPAATPKLPLPLFTTPTKQVLAQPAMTNTPNIAEQKIAFRCPWRKNHISEGSKQANFQNAFAGRAIQSHSGQFKPLAILLGKKSKQVL
jgi:hypothetical protein